ncbi:GNAT family N-acetyltransferase [Paenibacillus spongiae]|uniref:GNAT family N-acetyltransferase n=1 Tax=Paenibacillus spongiae TaxID=2909671 RepID=A0ABY5S3I9_9BACL|nr:GNAT family N-acetyltransferase [Paenibacillus spongiae]UVI28461.1 GNAT family N-acetyltransferase [Paenibacillus spongiae]
MFTVIRADKTELDVRSQMSEIFADGFTQWLGFFSKDKNTIAKAFAHMFVLDQFYVAITGNKVAGMAACTDGTALSVRLNKKQLRKYLGFFKGSLAGFILKREFEKLLENPFREKCSIEFVGTALEYRGQGAATQIIGYLVESTSYKEYLIEEVADTNIPAIRLYTKLGFEEYKRKPIPAKMAKKNGLNHLVSLKYVKWQ